VNKFATISDFNFILSLPIRWKIDENSRCFATLFSRYIRVLSIAARIFANYQGSRELAMSICNETITSSTFIMHARDSRMVARLKDGTVWCNLRKLFSINYNSEARDDEILIHSGWKVRMILDISSRNFSLATYGVIVIVCRRARWRRDEYSRNTWLNGSISPRILEQ